MQFKVAERIRNSFADDVDNKGMPVSCSIGVATWPTDGVMREEIIQASDAALYFAKQKDPGKNRQGLYKIFSPERIRTQILWIPANRSRE